MVNRVSRLLFAIACESLLACSAPAEQGVTLGQVQSADSCESVSESSLGPPHYPASTVADVDGDGLVDLLAPGGGGIVWSRALGHGTFAAPVMLASGLPVGTFSMVDIDGDHRLDIVAYGAGQLSLLRNEGDGSFSSKGTYVTDPKAQSIAVSDIDDDGNIDVVVTNGLSKSISVFRAQCGFELEPRVDYPIASWAYASALVDLNGDGKPEIVVAGLSWTTVFANDGNGRFAESARLRSRNPASMSIATGDFDGDGLTDVAIDDGYLIVYRNTGNGSIELLSRQWTEASGIDAADIDHDGHVEIVTTGPAGITVWRWNGSALQTVAQRNGLAYGAAGILLTDVDADGFTDAIVNGGDILFNDRHDRFGVPAGSVPHGEVYEDFDGDGIVDVIGFEDLGPNGMDGRNVRVKLGAGGGAFVDGPTFTPAIHPSLLTVGDFDGDGLRDIAVLNRGWSDEGSWRDGEVAVHRNRGDGTFELLTRYGVGDEVHEIKAADLNGDGIDEIYVNQRFAFVDVNGDGLKDVVSWDMTVYLNDGRGTFDLPPVNGWTLDYSDASSFYVGDIDEDGKPDVVRAYLHGFAFQHGRGDGTFETPSPNVLEGAQWSHPASTIAIFDYDGDGHLDVLQAAPNIGLPGEPSKVGLFRGRGDGTFDPAIVHGGYWRFAGVADMNGDGSPELLVDRDYYGFSALSTFSSGRTRCAGGTVGTPVSFGVPRVCSSRAPVDAGADHEGADAETVEPPPSAPEVADGAASLAPSVDAPTPAPTMTHPVEAGEPVVAAPAGCSAVPQSSGSIAGSIAMLAIVIAARRRRRTLSRSARGCVG